MARSAKEVVKFIAHPSYSLRWPSVLARLARELCSGSRCRLEQKTPLRPIDSSPARRARYAVRETGDQHTSVFTKIPLTILSQNLAPVMGRHHCAPEKHVRLSFRLLRRPPLVEMAFWISVIRITF